MLLEVKNLSRRFARVHRHLQGRPRGAAGEVRRHRAERLGQEHALQSDLGVYKPEPGASVCSTAQDITGKESHEIARLGVARTFQMLRIFQGMSVIENMLVGHHAMMRYGCRLGRDRIAGSVARGAPRARRDDGAARLHRACRLRRDAGRRIVRRAAPAAGARPRHGGMKPKLLMLDEPGAGLSPTNVDILLDTVLRAAQALRADRDHHRAHPEAGDGHLRDRQRARARREDRRRARPTRSRTTIA